MKTRKASCAICGEERQAGEDWFVLVENRWTDRLKILTWNETLASSAGTHLACGAAHVQQLVVHWMTMGTLEYPFAEAPSAITSTRLRRTREPHEPEAEPSGSRLVGELAVHRESLERIVRENPESLAAILEALTSALTNAGDRSVQAQEDIEESTEVCALHEV
jgi:hypothetical protein